MTVITVGKKQDKRPGLTNVPDSFDELWRLVPTPRFSGLQVQGKRVGGVGTGSIRYLFSSSETQGLVTYGGGFRPEKERRSVEKKVLGRVRMSKVPRTGRQSPVRVSPNL